MVGKGQNHISPVSMKPKIPKDTKFVSPQVAGRAVRTRIGGHKHFFEVGLVAANGEEANIAAAFTLRRPFAEVSLMLVCAASFYSKKGWYPQRISTAAAWFAQGSPNSLCSYLLALACGFPI